MTVQKKTNSRPRVSLSAPVTRMKRYRSLRPSGFEKFWPKSAVDSLFVAAAHAYSVWVFGKTPNASADRAIARDLRKLVVDAVTGNEDLQRLSLKAKKTSAYGRQFGRDRPGQYWKDYVLHMKRAATPGKAEVAAVARVLRFAVHVYSPELKLLETYAPVKTTGSVMVPLIRLLRSGTHTYGALIPTARIENVGKPISRGNDENDDDDDDGRLPNNNDINNNNTTT